MENEKRLLIAFALSGLVLLGWYLLFPPPEAPAPSLEAPVEETPAEAAPAAETAEMGAAPAGATPDAHAAAERYRAVLAASPEEPASYENAFMKVRLGGEGGRIVSVLLLHHFDAEGRPLELVYGGMLERPAGAPLALRIPQNPAREKEANAARYALEREGEGGNETFTLIYASEDGFEARKTLRFRADSYLVEAEVEARENGQPLPVFVQLGPGFGADEEMPEARFSHLRECVFGRPIGGGRAEVDRAMKAAILKQAAKQETGRLGGWFSKRLPVEPLGGHALKVLANPSWAGMGDNYFTALAFASEAFSEVRLQVEEKTMPAATKKDKPRTMQSVALLVPARELRALAFVPKERALLQSLDGGLADLVNLGVFWWLALPLQWLLDLFHRGVGNYGFAIILVTVVIKVLFHPLTHKSMVSMRRMQKLQPKMNALKEKYKKKNDMESRQAMNQEMMDLYKREGVNPLGGCLPMLLQMPVLFGFYSLLSVSIQLRQAPFLLWIRDLSVPDPYYVTPLVMGVSMFIQQRMSTPPNAGNDLQMRMMRWMPLFFTWIFLNLPSGLVLYWLTNNILTIAQQYWINKHVDGHGESHKPKPGKKHKPKHKKPEDAPAPEGEAGADA